jgi:hypothetical protein
MAVLRRYLIDRWRPSLSFPPDWTLARREVGRIFGALQRVLDVLHPAVEHPPVRVEATVASTGATVINATSPADATGLAYTFTPEVTGTVLVTGIFDVQCTTFGAVNQPFAGTLEVNGTPQAAQAILSPTAVNLRTMAVQSWTVPVTASTAYTFKLRGATANVASIYNLAQTHSTMTLVFLPAAWKINL